MKEQPQILGKPATWWHCEDVRLNMSKTRLAAWTSAVLRTGSKFGDYFVFGHRPRDSWCATVLVIDGYKDAFEQMAGVTLTPPPRIQVGCTEYT